LSKLCCVHCLVLLPVCLLCYCLAEKQYFKKLMKYNIAYEDGILSSTHTWNILMLHRFFNPSHFFTNIIPILSSLTAWTICSYSSFSKALVTSSCAFTGLGLSHLTVQFNATYQEGPPHFVPLPSQGPSHLWSSFYTNTTMIYVWVYHEAKKILSHTML